MANGARRRFPGLARAARASRAVVILAVSALGACGSGDDDPGALPGTLGQGDAGSDAPAPPPPDGSLPPPIPPAPYRYRGVNLAGAEFGGALPGTDGTDYLFPTNAEVDYYVSKGMNTFRVEFKWERLQASKKAAFEAPYFAKLDALVVYATSKSARVILNPQNFARYYGDLVGSSAVPNDVFANLWTRLATKYASNAGVLFNLVNEPHDMPTEQWVSAANVAIVAIRAAGAKNVVIVPGNAYTAGWTWYDDWYGTPNAVAMLTIVDPGDNVLFEAHQYLDADASGKSDQCVSATVGSERLAPFVKWLRENGKKGFLGEFAGGRNDTCYAAVTDMLKYITAQSDVLVGWTWWAGGPRWGDAYPFTLEPSGGTDRPQMGLLAPYFAK